MFANLQRAVATTAVVAAGAGLLGFSAGNVTSMDHELKALAPTERVLDGEMVLERHRCHRAHPDAPAAPAGRATDARREL